MICKKLEGLSYPASYSPDLPDIRVSDDPPFTHVGVDFAGPVYIRANSASENLFVYLCDNTRGTLGINKESNCRVFPFGLSKIHQPQRPTSNLNLR